MVQSFTTQYLGRARVLINDVTVHAGFTPGVDPATPGKSYKAIWDTGATNSAISKRVVDDLALEQEGMATVGTAGGKEKAPVYYVNIVLPNGVSVPMLRAAQLQFTGADLLIGMDIIGAGDFAVTCQDGKTTFSYRYPSVQEIDFTGKSTRRKKPGIPSPGRNDPCHCGSGKKFKKCHGA